ncbi:hypothetical protein F4703DRAFT_1347909 [Phycomyces blakesleeanus]
MQHKKYCLIYKTWKPSVFFVSPTQNNNNNNNPHPSPPFLSLSFPSPVSLSLYYIYIYTIYTIYYSFFLKKTLIRIYYYYYYCNHHQICDFCRPFFPSLSLFLSFFLYLHKRQGLAFQPTHTLFSLLFFFVFAHPRSLPIVTYYTQPTPFLSFPFFFIYLSIFIQIIIIIYSSPVVL